MSEKTKISKDDLKRFIDATHKRGGALKSITAVFRHDLEEGQWFVEVEIGTNVYDTEVSTLQTSRGEDKAFKTLDTLAKYLKELEAKEVVIKLQS